MIYVPYCSSDGYVGNLAAAECPFGWNFMGRAIVVAVFREAMKRGLGARDGTQVLYGGCSAGARGAMFNLDYVGRMLSSSIPGKVSRFGGLLDSCFWMDVEPFVTKPSLAQNAQKAFQLFQAAGTLEPTCLNAFPSSENWKCLFGQYSLPHVTTPYILNSFQYDAWQLGYNGITAPLTPDKLEYCETFRNTTRYWFLRDVNSDPKYYRTAVLPACVRHCNTEDSHFNTLTTKGVTLEKAVVSWFFGENTVVQFIEDDCVGYNCGPGCSA